MQERQLYAQILGIESPWRVERARKQQEVHIYWEHKAGGTWRCRQGGRECALHGHQPARRWRHLDTCQYRTILHAAPPRSDGPEPGALTVKLPWAAPSSRFTVLFERLASDWLRAASQQDVEDVASPKGSEFPEALAVVATFRQEKIYRLYQVEFQDEQPHLEAVNKLVSAQVAH